jgi:hypothetical protein
MSKKSRKKKRLALILPRAGPPTNVRPGGFHQDRRRVRRTEVKAELRQYEIDPNVD